MIRFAVFDESGPVGDFAPRNAYLIGKEDLTVPGTIAFKNGALVCSRHNNDAASLALQVDLADLGSLTLRTCLLPDRVDPYVLDIELARHRIMLLINNLEEWGLSGLPADHPVMQGFEEARALFTRAMTTPRGEGNSGDTERARLARESLAMGVRTSEKLAILQAERELELKFNPPPEGDPDETASPDTVPKPIRIGCVVPPGQFAEPLQKIVQQTFGFISCPLRWRDIEADEGRHAFATSDRWIEWAVRSAKIPVAAGPVIDLSARALPEWIYIWEHDYKTLRELAYEHLKAVVTRYRRAVNRWSPVAGLNTNSAFLLRIEEMIDLTRLAVLTTRKLHPSAKVIVEITHPFGEHGTYQDRSISPVLYAGLVKEAGIQIDGFGLRLQMGDPEPGRSARDLMEFSSLLDLYAQFDKPIHVTALGAPSQPINPRTKPPLREGGPGIGDFHACAGSWHGQWSLANQAEWMTQVISIASGKPYVESVAWQALFDTAENSEMAYGGLITGDGRAKPALRRMREIAAAFRAKQSPTSLPALGEPAGEPAASTASS